MEGIKKSLNRSNEFALLETLRYSDVISLIIIPLNLALVYFQGTGALLIIIIEID